MNEILAKDGVLTACGCLSGAEGSCAVNSSVAMRVTTRSWKARALHRILYNITARRQIASVGSWEPASNTRRFKCGRRRQAGAGTMLKTTAISPPRSQRSDRAVSALSHTKDLLRLTAAGVLVASDGGLRRCSEARRLVVPVGRWCILALRVARHARPYAILLSRRMHRA